MKVYNYGNDYAYQLRKKLDKGAKTIVKPVAYAKDENIAQPVEAVCTPTSGPACATEATDERANQKKGRKAKTEEKEASESAEVISEL